jgi:hypothetical protein
VIPTEAVEAAAKALYYASGRSRQMPYSVAHKDCEAEARVILQAVAPYMLDNAKAEALIEAIDAVPPISHGIDADERFANGYNEALRRVRAAVAAGKGASD